MYKEERSVVGIMPAAGKGTRLAPYPGAKELFPIGWQDVSIDGTLSRRPKVVSQYTVEAMALAGADRLIAIVGEHKFDVLRYYGSGKRFGIDIAYLYQSEPRGMAHAIDIAYPWARESRIILGMPDTVIRPPRAYAEVLAAHNRHRPVITLGLFATRRSHKSGMIGVDDSGNVTHHADKPRTTNLRHTWGNAVWEPEFTQLLHEAVAAHGKDPDNGNRKELVLGDVIDIALGMKLPVRGCVVESGTYADIGTFDEIMEISQFMDHSLEER